MTKYMSKEQITDPATMKRKNDNYNRKKGNKSSSSADNHGSKDGGPSIENSKSLAVSKDGAPESAPRPEPIDDQKAPWTAYPTPNIPFKTQRQVLTTVQGMLEEACFDFAQQWVPTILRDKGIKEAEQVELTEWGSILGKEIKSIPKNATQRIPGTSFTQELTATHQLRDAAVHRQQLSVARMLELIGPARNLVIIMKDDKRTAVIEQILEMIEHNVSHLDEHQQRIRAQLTVDLDFIEKKRIAWDELEKQRINDAMQKEEGNYTTFGTLLNDYLDNLKSRRNISEEAVCVKSKLQQGSEPVGPPFTDSSVLSMAARRFTNEMRAAAELIKSTDNSIPDGITAKSPVPSIFTPETPNVCCDTIGKAKELAVGTENAQAVLQPSVFDTGESRKASVDDNSSTGKIASTGNDPQQGPALTLPTRNCMPGAFPTGMPEALSKGTHSSCTVDKTSNFDTSSSTKASVGHDKNTDKATSDVNGALKSVPFTFTSNFSNNGAFAFMEVPEQTNDFSWSTEFLAHTSDPPSLTKSSVVDAPATVTPAFLSSDQTQPKTPEFPGGAGGEAQGGGVWDRARDVKLTGALRSMSYDGNTAASAISAANLVKSEAPSEKKSTFRSLFPAGSSVPNTDSNNTAGTNEPQGQQFSFASFMGPTSALITTTRPPAAGDGLFHFPQNPPTSNRPPAAGDGLFHFPQNPPTSIQPPVASPAPTKSQKLAFDYKPLFASELKNFFEQEDDTTFRCKILRCNNYIFETENAWKVHAEHDHPIWYFSLIQDLYRRYTSNEGSTAAAQSPDNEAGDSHSQASNTVTQAHSLTNTSVLPVFGQTTKLGQSYKW